MTSLTPPQYIAAAIRTLMFRQPSGCLGAGQVSAIPPYYIITEGKNLFETIMFSLPLCDDPDKKDLPLWETNYIRKVPELIANDEFGYLASQFIPAKTVRFGEFDENGNVISIYTEDIKLFKDEPKNKPQQYSESFHKYMPYARFFTVEKEKKEVDMYMRPEAPGDVYKGRSLWQNLISHDIENLNGEGGRFFEPLSFIRYLANKGVAEKNSFAFKAYGLSIRTQSSPFYYNGLISFELPKDILLSEDKEKVLNNISLFADNAVSDLSIELKKMCAEIKCRKDMTLLKEDEQKKCEKDCSDVSLIRRVVAPLERYEQEKLEHEYTDIVLQYDTETAYNKCTDEIVNDVKNAFKRIYIPRKNYIAASKYRNFVYANLKKMKGAET